MRGSARAGGVLGDTAGLCAPAKLHILDPDRTERRCRSGSAVRTQAPTRTAKNPIHLDLRPVNRAAAVARAVELGATLVLWGANIDAWTVLADPEGNEFCILQSETDYAAFAVNDDK
ncbi:VOC family protein [Nocardia stercoris]|uniref:VOC family protein n=1 Tax=Nocardia stercoris TaxID=2483361 RepID=UPI001F200D81|nr:VOC family protein [Nocardia stercoris]